MAWLSIAVATLLVVGTALSTTLAVIALGNARQLKTTLSDLQDQTNRYITKEQEARAAEERATTKAAEALAAQAAAEKSESDAKRNETKAKDTALDLEKANTELADTIAKLRAADSATSVAVTKAEKADIERQRATYEGTLEKARNLVKEFRYVQAVAELESCPKEMRDDAWQSLMQAAQGRDLTIVPLGDFGFNRGRAFATNDRNLFVVNVLGTGLSDESFRPDEKVHLIDVASGETVVTQNHARYLTQWNEVLLTYEADGVGKYDLGERKQLPLERVTNFEPGDCMPLYFVGSNLFFYSLNLRNNITLDLEAHSVRRGPSLRNNPAAKDKFCLMADVPSRTSVWLSNSRGKLSLMTVGPSGTINPLEEFSDLALVSQGATTLAARRLAVAFSDRVEVWTPERRVALIRTPEIGVRILALSADGQLLATWSADHAVMVWNAENGEQSVSFAGQQEVQNLHFAADNRLTWISERGLCVWNPQAKP